MKITIKLARKLAKLVKTKKRRKSKAWQPGGREYNRYLGRF